MIIIRNHRIHQTNIHQRHPTGRGDLLLPNRSSHEDFPRRRSHRNWSSIWTFFTMPKGTEYAFEMRRFYTFPVRRQKLAKWPVGKALVSQWDCNRFVRAAEKGLVEGFGDVEPRLCGNAMIMTVLLGGGRNWIFFYFKRLGYRRKQLYIDSF